jgi:hypothetical protein
VKSQEQHVLTLGGTGSICVDVRNIIARFKDIPLDKVNLYLSSSSPISSYYPDAKLTFSFKNSQVTENSRLVIDLRVTPTDRFYIISRVKTVCSRRPYLMFVDQQY